MNLLRRGAKYCSPKCGTYYRRKRNGVPAALTSRDRWVRRNASKVPLTVSGGAASSTNPATWSSFKAASKSTVGNGLGFVLGGGVGAYDLDHCITDGAVAPWAVEFIHGIPEPVLYMERSMSGSGLHVFIEAPEGAGRKIRDGRNIERYTKGRYIAFTGDTFSL